MKRVLSGIKPSGEVTLGNYLGAMKRWADEQGDSENFYFVPNLHALTTEAGRQNLKEHTLSAVAWLLAMGVDPDKSTIFVQSQIPAHSELAWILNNFVTMGELARQTQYKDKSKKQGSEGQVAGLFNYPVLMAADILLYGADEVPVGDDQKQHVELARDIAQRFNNKYDGTFKMPEPTIQTQGARIMNLQDPARKMSASDEDSAGTVFLTDSVDQIRDKFKKAVTDSGSEIKAADDKPAVTNLLQIFSLVSGKSVAEIEKAHNGKGYGDLKADLAEAVVGMIEPLQKTHTELLSDAAKLDAILAGGAEKAGEIATKKLAEVKAKLGLI